MSRPQVEWGDVELSLYSSSVIVRPFLTYLPNSRETWVARARVHGRRGGRAEPDRAGASPESRAPVSALGIVGMRERTASLKGAFEVESEPGAATRLTVEIPLL